MASPFFYIENIDPGAGIIILNEETSKHIVQVLRMQIGEQLQLTDGKGKLITADITDNDRKKCTVQIVESSTIHHSPSATTIAISLIKNNNRFEWFLEKATEIGVSSIIPLICERTEKHNFRHDRMKAILVSALLQSRQCWLPVLHEPVVLGKFWQSLKALPNLEGCQQKFIAHCMETEKRNLSDLVNESLPSRIILIGPEGDFTHAEIQQAIEHHFIPVALGNTRLRTETAGLVAAVILSQS
jgi:16S rRNA (uracil1498-N3)-methyltransferase